MGLSRYVHERPLGLHTLKKRSGIFLAEPSFPPTTDHRFVEDLGACPRSLPQNFHCSLSLLTIVKHVEHDICVCEVSVHARRRGLDARPWAVSREIALTLAGLHRR